MMPIAPFIPIRLLGPRAAASSALHFEISSARRSEMPPRDSVPPMGLPMPNPSLVVDKVALSILHCRDMGEVRKAVWSGLGDFLWAKLNLMGDLFPDPRKVDPGNLQGLSKQAAGATADLLRNASTRWLNEDARFAALSGTSTLEACNAAFLSSFFKNPGRFVGRAEFERYAVGVLAIEMIQAALLMVLIEKGRPRSRSLPSKLAYSLQLWGEELYHLAKGLGFFSRDEASFDPVTPPDEDTIRLAEEAWFEAAAETA